MCFGKLVSENSFWRAHFGRYCICSEKLVLEILSRNTFQNVFHVLWKSYFGNPVLEIPESLFWKISGTGNMEITFTMGKMVILKLWAEEEKAKVSCIERLRMKRKWGRWRGKQKIFLGCKEGIFIS